MYYDENAVGNFNRLLRSVSILALAKLSQDWAFNHHQCLS
jgi:hypothetical protein